MRKSEMRSLATVLGFLLATVLVPTARCEEPRLSISGYDPVAYFTDGRPVQGSPEFEYIWHKLRWPSPPGSIAPCSSRIRSTTRRNTTAIAPWARRTTRRRTRTPSIRRPGPLSTANSISRTTGTGSRSGERTPRSTSSTRTRAGPPSRLCLTRSSSDHPAPLRRRPRSSHCVMAGIGSLLPASSHATGSGMLSARAICGRRLSRSARTWASASRRAGRASRTLLARSATSRTWPNSASTLIYASAISGRRRSGHDRPSTATARRFPGAGRPSVIR